MTKRLCEDALGIWQAGVAAVLPDGLIRRSVICRPAANGDLSKNDSSLAEIRGAEFLISVGGETFPLTKGGRVLVIGMGKASGKMAEGLEDALSPLGESGRLTGWVNVPDNALLPLKWIHLHPGRPAGVNEPTEAGVEGSRRILALIESARPEDLIIALISGGGSALLPLPIPAITLAEKQNVTRFLSGAGANIGELNTVRKELSLVKGGGLRRAARGKRLLSLILSDVLGDSLDVIASGATVPNSTNACDALAVLEKYDAASRPELTSILQYLRTQAEKQKNGEDLSEGSEDYAGHRPFILANNRTAVDAAAEAGERLGYRFVSESATVHEPEVGALTFSLLGRVKMAFQGGKASGLASGGEPVVHLVSAEKRGVGGRNTQLVLTALLALLKGETDWPFQEYLILSAGTDGEDGPTDAAGAFIDDEAVRKFRELFQKGEFSLAEMEDYLARNDSYSFFKRFGGLIQTGATGTNVCDLRLILAADDFSPKT